MIFRRKPKIEFYSVIPEVAVVAPIVPATKFKPVVFENAVRHLSELKQQPDFGMHKRRYTGKCSGIFNYVRYGWVLTTWQDIVITTNGDGTSFSWSTPLNQVAMTNGHLAGEQISFHAADAYADYMGGTIPNSISTVVKINTPWRCVVPKGYYLFEHNMPHTDESRFTTVEGFYSDDYGSAPINVQLFWHVMQGETLIKAGTPIAHYMLMPKDQHDLVVRGASDRDLAAEHVVFCEIERRNTSNIKESKCVFAKVFGGKDA